MIFHSIAVGLGFARFTVTASCFGPVLVQEMVDNQFHAFCFLARAPRLVMAHSTFSWWTAFLGNATEIHYPLQPRGVTTPKVMVDDEPRYVYRNDAGKVISPH